MSLTALLKRGSFGRSATATVATTATVRGDSRPTVAEVANVAVATPPNSSANDAATHRPATTQNAPPTSSEARLRLFARRGLSGTQADALADRLVIRDRDQDERRTCLECSHCTGAAPLSWRCGNHRAAGVGRELGSDLAVMLQRCAGFKEAV